MEISEEHLDGFTPRNTAEDAFCAAGRCIREIKNAKKPVLLAGGGIRAAGCTDAFKRLVKKTGIPVVTTLNGIDAIDNAYGFSGLNGHPCCNKALSEADLLLALGVRFGQRQIGKSIEGYTNAKIIRIEIDDSKIGRSFIKEDFGHQSGFKNLFRAHQHIRLQYEFFRLAQAINRLESKVSKRRLSSCEKDGSRHVCSGNAAVLQR